MACYDVCSVLLLLLCFVQVSVGEYTVPDLKFEAFEPKGVRVSIPAQQGVELFAFHGKLNNPILPIEPGEFTEDVVKPTNGRFVYFNPSLKLQIGDKINYWAFVQSEQLGFRKDDQSWTVDKLLPLTALESPPVDTSPASGCITSITKVLKKNTVCSGDKVIDYSFTESPLNSQFWQIEKYYPNEPDWEYVIYTSEPDVLDVRNNALQISPKVVAENINKTIVIDGCTRLKDTTECTNKFAGIYHPPIVSGRIVSQEAFCFGNITVRAKLPQGDWIFPEIYLEAVGDPKKRILIAFARGNRELTSPEGTDIGGRYLLGGPYKLVKRQPRDKFLKSYRGENHFGADYHVYTVAWTKDQITLYVDDINYGQINAAALLDTGFNRETMVRLVLGVGAGGKYDFPDNSVSGPNPKPWKNVANTAMRSFIRGREQWHATWNDNTKLLVDYVVVTAL